MVASLAGGQRPAMSDRLAPRARGSKLSGRFPAAWSKYGSAWLSVLAVLALFELLSRLEVLPPRYFPPVTVTISRLGEELPDPEFWSSIAKTLQGWALGLAIAALIAIPLGMAIGLNRWLYRSTRLVIEFLRPVPSVALVPLAVLLYGTGMETKVFLTSFACLWPLLFQTVYGVQDVDPVALDTARIFGLGPAARLRHVVLPSTTPYIATGLRISSSIALILSVTAEIVVGMPGLGSTIALAQAGNALDLMYAAIIVAGLLGWTLNIGFRRLERVVLQWHPTQRAEQPA